MYMKKYTDTYNRGIYKYMYDPDLAFDFRFHQRLASAPFQKTNVPWATLMFSTKQPKPLTNVLSHHYKSVCTAEDGSLHELGIKRLSVPVNVALVSNDMTKLYECDYPDCFKFFESYDKLKLHKSTFHGVSYDGMNFNINNMNVNLNMNMGMINNRLIQGQFMNPMMSLSALVPWLALIDFRSTLRPKIPRSSSPSFA